MTKANKKTASVKTRYGVFSCVFEVENDMGGYSATAPKVQGVVSWGRNLAEAKHKVSEAIEAVYEANIIIAAEKAGVVRFVHGRSPAQIA